MTSQNSMNSSGSKPMQGKEVVVLAESSAIDPPMEKDSRIQWWLGLTDLGSQSLTQGALGVERMHLSIADETFDILARIPTTRPYSEPVRVLHHGISTLCYRSVAGVGRLLSRQLGKD
ncbi:MAG: hypothetical protein R3296_07325 [Oleiphilaceae bacterium]|nr:hypothetical protein [Oleiphilaceae bacterium]